MRVDQVTVKKQLRGTIAIRCPPVQGPSVSAGSEDDSLAVRCPERRSRASPGLRVTELPDGVLFQIKDPDVRLPQGIADGDRNVFPVLREAWLAILTSCGVNGEGSSRAIDPGQRCLLYTSPSPRD